MAKSAAAKRHHEKLAAMPCIVSRLLSIPQTTPTEVHHIRAGQGMGQRAGHFLAIPLSAEMHRGPDGIHGSRKYLSMLKMTELDLLDSVLEIIS